ncbi:YjfB family protein [Paenalkalicoccus suaedae]|uniref:YjfB family protein n=1 Tax=Paenalkalicoccus suaedae TaxID=2592382 RepID=A0A859FKI2_9BACI|nr:YjfB family protein [Paenalkalicoccus suaedae]
MDIARLAMGMSQQNVQQQASIAVMKQSLDMATLQADGLTKLLASADAQALQHAAQPHLGGHIDVSL